MREFILLSKMFLKIEFRSLERQITPLIFALAMILILNFSFGALSPEARQMIFCGEIFVTVFFSIQIILLRALQPELEDDVLSALISASSSVGKIYFAKTLSLFISALSVTIPILFFQFLIKEFVVSFSWLTVPFFVFVMLALCAVGTVCLLLVHQSKMKETLFPILFFPLSVPVFLAAIEGTASLSAFPPSLSQVWPWLFVLGLINLINVLGGYFVFSIIFEE